MKSKTLIILLACLLIFCISVPAMATDNSREYALELSRPGSSPSAAAQVRDKVEVVFTLKRVDSGASGSYAMYGMQNEITYDTTRLRLDSYSILSSGFQVDRDMLSDGIHERIIVTHVIDLPNGTILLDSVDAVKMVFEVLKSGDAKIENRKSKIMSAIGDTYVISRVTDLIIEATESTSPPDPGGDPGKDPNKDPNKNPKDPEKDQNNNSNGSNPQGGKLTNFIDVAENSWYEVAVQYVVSHGLFKGLSDTIFDPEGIMNRAMFVTVLSRMEFGSDSAVPTFSYTFTDLRADWYKKAVGWAANYEIVKGFSSTRFGPTDNVTREQMAAILYRYAGYKGYSTTHNNSVLNNYTDRSAVSGYAVDAMAWAVTNGLIEGMNSTTLAPGNPATRAQVATIMMRFNEWRK